MMMRVQLLLLLLVMMMCYLSLHAVQPRRHRVTVRGHRITIGGDRITRCGDGIAVGQAPGVGGRRRSLLVLVVGMVVMHARWWTAHAVLMLLVLMLLQAILTHATAILPLSHPAAVTAPLPGLILLDFVPFIMAPRVVRGRAPITQVGHLSLLLLMVGMLL